MKNTRHRFATLAPYQCLSAAKDLSAGDVPGRLSAIMEDLRGAGVTGIVCNAAAFGKALHHTKVATPFEGVRTESGRNIAVIREHIDILAIACAAARQAGLEYYISSRMYDDYFPGMGSLFEKEHPEARWESRDGEFSLRGVLSLSYGAVRKYRLAVLEELSLYDATGIVIDLATTAAAFTPFRRRDFFGYNAPVAEAHARRTGEDIREFESVQYRRGGDLQIVDALYEGEFDAGTWHEVKGEFFASFLEEASAILKQNGRRVALSRGREEGILPMARMRLQADRWLAGGILDDLLLPRGPGEDAGLETYLAARPAGSRVMTDTEGLADGHVADYATLLGP